MKQIEYRVSRSTLIAISVAGFAIIGFLFALANIVNYSQLGNRFTPFSVAYRVSALTYDETELYVAVARRFFEKNSVRPEVDVFELRDTVGVYAGAAHSIVLGSMAKLVGSLEISWIIGRALFPASIWLLFFF